ncbi:hypothetical protein AB0L13_16585 [Saccharopolyspora shandongensis]|uniref:hypothetical protein n=1 Tax=Saccharopolyspora shandongensis TaxID=418495 RepID=UPI003441B76E
MATRDLVFTILGIDRASRTFDKVGDSVDRLGKRATLALAGTTAASAAAGAAVAATVGALPLVFAAFGAAALRNNTAVRASFESLSATVQDGLAADAAPLEGAFVGAAERIGAAYVELRPQFREAFAASAPYVTELTDGVVGFARNAMPGMVTAVRSAGPVIDGMSSLMADAGVGVGEFFEVVATGSDNAGEGVAHFGQLIAGVLPEVGSLLVNATGLWAEHGDEVADVVTRLMGVINDMSGSALPVMSAAVGVALDVLSGVLDVVEPLSGVLGPLIGTWLALAAAMRGIRAVRDVVAGAATSVMNFGEQTRRAAGAGGVGMLTQAGRGLLATLGGPFGAALAAASVALAIFGSASQSAEGDQRSLASALRDSAGAFDSNARSALMQSEQYQGIADAVEKAGLTHAEYIDALISGGPALDNLKAKLQQQVATAFETQGSFQGVTGSLREQSDASTNLLMATDGLRGTVVGAIDDQRQYTEAVFGSGTALSRAVPGTDSLREAMTTLKDTTADTADRVDALNTAWRQMFGIQLDLEEATAQFEEGMDNLRDSLEGVRGGTANWQAALFAADGQINTTTEEGRELAENLTQQGEHYRTLAQTAYDTALRQNKSQQEATAIAVAAIEQRREQFIREAQQMGFTADQARMLADRYFGIPRDVSTFVTTPGAWEAVGAANAVRDAVNSIPLRRHIEILVSTRGQGQSNPGSGIPLPLVQRAAGGPIASQRPVLVGEQGPELLVPSGPGRVLPTHQTRRLLAQSAPEREPGPRATVNIGTFVAAPNQSPYDIAADLDWFARGGG